jgi:hypothetical protein
VTGTMEGSSFQPGGGSGEPAPDDRHEERDAAEVLAALREPVLNVHLLRGFGPLVAAAVVALLMIALLPSVAPERVVERPATSGAAEGTP